ncbi:hypothetical protein Tco_0684298 [Tanacetum coccineum]
MLHVYSSYKEVSVMRNEEKVARAAVAIPLDIVKEMSSFFNNMLFGYFIGKRLAFPLVESYGMEKVLENGSWLISMCLNPWGKSAYARVLIEMSAETELPELVVVAIPFLDGTGHSLETIDVEYEWKPPRCNTCCIFDNVDDQCPKKPRVVTTTQEDKDGFMEVKRKKKKAKVPIKMRQEEGIKLTKPKLNLQYRRVDKVETSTTHEENKVDSMIVDPKLNEVRPYSESNTWLNAKQVLDVINDSDSKDVDEVMDLETPPNTGGATNVGEITPKEVVSNV